ncbi:MAG: threonine/serine exporter family protein [Prevotella sp.]|jgi:uncharacterized membrane protein YjjP (DUF1212 family)|nr:threonine/serine exporter family protein [Prevotella sp.]
MEKNGIHEEMRAVTKFLANYAATLMGVGVQSSRILLNTERMARALGYTTDIVLFQKTLSITLHSKDGAHNYTSVKVIPSMALNFKINMKLSRLSWEALDNHLSLPEIKKRYGAIVGEKRESPWTVLILVSFANACFCRLFDGNLTSMIIVWIATFIGFFIRQQLTKRGMLPLAVFAICSFVSTMIGASDYLFFHGGTEDMSLGTSMLYLVPGVPLINGVMDIIDHHVLNGISRLSNACLLVISMTIGLMLTLLVTGIDVTTFTHVVRPNLWLASIADGLFAAVAGTGFAIISNPPRKALVISAFLACVGHGIRYFLMHNSEIMMDQASASTIAAFAIGMLAIYFGKHIHCPSECFAFPSLLPMVPGMFAYKSVIALMKIVSSPESNTMEYVSMFFHNSMLTILVMFGMVVGCVIPIFIFYRESFSVTRMNADGNHSSRLSAQNIKHMLASRKIILNLQHK